jgi:hypothetical protein
MDAFEKFCAAFVRNPDGSWFCRAVAHLLGPQGPLTVTPGVTYRKGRPVQGYDIAQWLDDWNNHRAVPVGIQFL